MKHFNYLILSILLSACSNNIEESVERNEAHSDVDETTDEDVVTEQFDSTALIGTWEILQSDRSVLEYRYVGGMPESFRIDDLEQIRHGSLKARFDNSFYPFMLNKIEEDSLILYLHPGACKCEGLEARYRKRAEDN